MKLYICINPEVVLHLRKLDTDWVEFSKVIYEYVASYTDETEILNVEKIRSLALYMVI